VKIKESFTTTTTHHVIDGTEAVSVLDHDGEIHVIANVIEVVINDAGKYSVYVTKEHERHPYVTTKESARRILTELGYPFTDRVAGLYAPGYGYPAGSMKFPVGDTAVSPVAFMTMVRSALEDDGYFDASDEAPFSDRYGFVLAHANAGGVSVQSSRRSLDARRPDDMGAYLRSLEDHGMYVKVVWGNGAVRGITVYPTPPKS
jgi:hypothetical protein